MVNGRDRQCLCLTSQMPKGAKRQMKGLSAFCWLGPDVLGLVDWLVSPFENVIYDTMSKLLHFQTITTHKTQVINMLKISS